MGAARARKTEPDPRALSAADAFICDRAAPAAALGELRAALAAGLWPGGRPAELGEVVTGRVRARRGEADVTICDLTGTGAQDTAIASHVNARLGSAGTSVTS